MIHSWLLNFSEQWQQSIYLALANAVDHPILVLNYRGVILLMNLSAELELGQPNSPETTWDRLFYPKASLPPLRGRSHGQYAVLDVLSGDQLAITTHRLGNNQYYVIRAKRIKNDRFHPLYLVELFGEINHHPPVPEDGEWWQQYQQPSLTADDHHE